MSAIRYGDWHIQYDPPPIPVRTMDWHYWHDDFDGADDACDNRYGSVASLEAAMDEIDDYEAERFEEYGCVHGCRLGIEPGPYECMSTERCSHRDSVRARLAARPPSQPVGGA
ncbi:hypothetical protein SLG_21740 [Sphingobium sp. SYK-6]|uniref:hypothetical protein n=1 Tax=Sphingobium sp. (strain NBRC 103272 / SYK-6) TaxID=627192 RepID=UPI00022770A9|nr:hypothetical protein [Sphingobium sp. SYK-6]BAK66849.1 hypothetical protein SLG_21740 [Sphingobium sp. SYK-6]